MTGAELDRTVRHELAALRPETAREVARRLVMAGRLLDDDPETAWRHAAVAREKAARLASVREAVGLAAYATGRYAEALAELRTVRRLTGSNVHLPVMADCERGIGRPERALELAASEEARRLDLDGQVEMLIVAAGARADLGQLDAAVVTLQVPELSSRRTGAWLARLRSAYADALAAVGRTAEAQDWHWRAIEADVDGTAGIADADDDLLFEDLVDESEDGIESEDGDEDTEASAEAEASVDEGTEDTEASAEAEDSVDEETEASAEAEDSIDEDTEDSGQPAPDAEPEAPRPPAVTPPTGLFLEPARLDLGAAPAGEGSR